VWIDEILHDKNSKATQKRAQVAEMLREKALTMDDIMAAIATDKDVAAVLEAMEEVSRVEPSLPDDGWLSFAEEHIESASNTLKKEASRAIGNVAHLYPDKLAGIVQKLLANSGDDGTVVRWGSAYALARIVQIPAFAKLGCPPLSSQRLSDHQRAG
jgi:hypothetical protein